MSDNLFSSIKNLIKQFITTVIVILFIIYIFAGNILSLDKIWNYGFPQYFNNIVSFHISNKYAYTTNHLKIYERKLPITQLKTTQPQVSLVQGSIVRVDGEQKDGEIVWCAVKYLGSDGQYNHGFTHGTSPRYSGDFFEGLREISDNSMAEFGAYNVYKFLSQIYRQFSVITVKNPYERQGMIESGDFYSLEKLIKSILKAIPYKARNNLKYLYENKLVKKSEFGDIKKIMRQYFDLGILITTLYTEQRLLNSRLLYSVAMEQSFGDSDFPWVYKGGIKYEMKNSLFTKNTLIGIFASLFVIIPMVLRDLKKNAIANRHKEGFFYDLFQLIKSGGFFKMMDVASKSTEVFKHVESTNKVLDKWEERNPDGPKYKRHRLIDWFIKD